MVKAQMDLFGGPTMHEPAESLTAHTTSVIEHDDGTRSVVVRLKITQESIYTPLAEGPLTFGECLTWEEPCRLPCRYRLDDSIERRTRDIHEDELAVDTGEALVFLEDLRGPRLASGAYWSRTKVSAGTWCALRAAESGDERGGIPGLSLAEMAHLYGMTKEGVSKEVVDPAVQALKDLYDTGVLDDDLEELYGERGRLHKYKFPTEIAIEKAENVTSTEVKRLMVPGEVKRGRSVPTIKGRRWKKNGWAWQSKQTATVPEALADKMPATKLLKRVEPSAPIGKSQVDIGEMMRARKAQAEARAERIEQEQQRRAA